MTFFLTVDKKLFYLKIKAILPTALKEFDIQHQDYLEIVFT